MRRDGRKIYSGKQFLVGIAVMMAGLYGFGLINRAAITRDTDRQPGLATELYRLDPYTYGTPASPAWLKTQHAIEAVRQARMIAEQERMEDAPLPTKSGSKEDVAEKDERLAQRPQGPRQYAL